MLEEMWQIHELQLTHLVEMGRRWALGLKVEGVVGDGWGFWLGWGILLSNRNKGERRQMFCRSGAGPFPERPGNLWWDSLWKHALQLLSGGK